jgi:hypothetical protein
LLRAEGLDGAANQGAFAANFQGMRGGLVKARPGEMSGKVDTTFPSDISLNQEDESTI